MKDIRAQIESGIARPIFDSVGKDGHRNQSLPDVVLNNRKNRAYARVVDALESRGAASLPLETRKRLESMIEAWRNQAFDDAFQPIQEFEIQCARERDLVIAEQSGDPLEVLQVHEKDYRRRVIERFGSIELRGMQLNHRVILDLDQVFVPLHFESLPEKRADGKINLTKPRRSTLPEMLKDSSRIFLIGTPGSGKSTLVSFLASQCASGNHNLPWPERVLPLVLAVRELKEVGSQWTTLEIDPHLVTAALSEGRAALMIDGLDEAPEHLRSELLAALGGFVADHPAVPVLVTSRPAGAPDSIESALPGFQGYRLTDLTNDEVNTFIDKWCLAAERSSRPDASDWRGEAAVAADDLKARVQRSRPVQRLAANPLLTTILCVVHRFLGRTIPEHRVTLYEKCTDALLYEWDRAKFPKGTAVGNLDANQKRTLLRGVASALHERHEAEMPEAEVVRHFAATLPEMGVPPEEALRIVREIRDRSGVLVERRPGMFGFSHLTFQEYLTALHYASRTGELLSHLADPWWHEVVALTTGVPGSDVTRIIDTLLEKGDVDSIFLAAKCLETAVSVPLELRSKAEAALEKVPPSRLGIQKLREIGLTMAGILARRLPGYKGLDKSSALVFFDSFVYEPVIPILASMTADPAPGHINFMGGEAFTIGELATWVLFAAAHTSDRARAALKTVLSNQEFSAEFLDWLKPDEFLGDDFKPRRSKKPSRRAKSTG